MPRDQPADVDRLGIERLLAGKGQQALGQRRRALRAAHGAVDRPFEIRHSIAVL